MPVRRTADPAPATEHWPVRLAAYLPRGGSLPEAVFRRRHVALLWILAAHIPAIVALGLVRHVGVAEALLSAAPVGALWLAGWRSRRRLDQACLVAAGLVTASAMLVHLTGGLTEMHFHFFVVVALLTLYQDWMPFLTALVLIVIEHGAVGRLFPHSVYDHAGAWRDPWLWAAVHGAFVLAASTASLAAWSINERDHAAAKREIDQLRELREEELRYQTEHDPLTGLGNRRLLTEALDRVLLDVEQMASVALLFVDLDGFKSVNDLYGHDAGDLVLVEVGRRIAAAVRPTDLATRLGGDEFVVLCIGLVDQHAAVAIANRIEQQVARPIACATGEVQVTASVGIACSARWPHDAERLLHEADLAMYRAKQLGKDRCQLFDEELRKSMDERAAHERLLVAALDRDRLRLHYQPIFDLAGNIVAVEALLRIVAADGQLLLPAPYITVAEETGLISRLTEWVLRTACRQTAGWRRDYAPDLVVNVNVSGSEVGHERLADDIAAALAGAGLAPGALALELTETALLDAAVNKIRQLQRLKDSGVRIGLDDFGTGYTSLQHLRSLPISFVKLDMSFTRDIPASPADRAIVAAMATMSGELGFSFVAEGVETEEQLQTLRKLGVGLFQGYLLGRPVEAEEFTRRLAATGPACGSASRPALRLVGE